MALLQSVSQDVAITQHESPSPEFSVARTTNNKQQTTDNEQLNIVTRADNALSTLWRQSLGPRLSHTCWQI
jgi:hypothetical protein